MLTKMAQNEYAELVASDYRLRLAVRRHEDYAEAVRSRSSGDINEDSRLIAQSNLALMAELEAAIKRRDGRDDASPR